MRHGFPPDHTRTDTPNIWARFITGIARTIACAYRGRDKTRRSAARSVRVHQVLRRWERHGAARIRFRTAPPRASEAFVLNLRDELKIIPPVTRRSEGQRRGSPTATARIGRSAWRLRPRRRQREGAEFALGGNCANPRRADQDGRFRCRARQVEYANARHEYASTSNLRLFCTGEMALI